MMKRRWSKSGGFTDLRTLEESSSEVTSSSNGLVPSSGLSPNSLDSHDYGDQDWLCNDSYNTYQQSVITSAAHSCVSLPSQTTIIPLPPNASSQSNSSLTNGSGGGGGATNFAGHQPGGAALTAANLPAGMSALSGLSLITSNGSGGGCGGGPVAHLNGTASSAVHVHGLRMDQNGHGAITILASHQQGLSNGLHNNSQNGINGLMQQHTPRSESVNSISSGREDLSPSSSLNGYSTTEGCDAKKSKKGPAPRLQEELCLVCGDRASGYHYNALTCEGCKGFFRRSVTKNATYCCKFGHACEMDMYMRRKCQECRLKKCLAVGMRPECVVPENQCLIKRREKKAQKEKDKHQTSPSAVSTTDIVKKEILDLMTCEPLQHTPCPLLPDEIVAKCKARNIPPLTLNQLTVIYKLIWYQDGYEQPSEEDLKRIMSTPDENESPHDVNFRHITEITILTVQLIVEFAKGLPAFTKIPQEDQITLLKACSSEVMMLRMARRYDHSSDSIFFANNRSYTRDAYKMAGVADNIEDLLHFCRIMYAMKVDNVEYALLTAIVIFSDRPGLEEAELVETIQSYYIDTLRMYILNRHCGDPMSFVFFAKLLSILTELRTLGNQNAEMCFSLKLKNRKLPKFLEEIWDVHAIPPSVQSHIQATQAEKAALESVDGAMLPASAASSTTSLSSASVVGPGGVCALDGGVSLHSTDGSLTVVAASSSTAGLSVASSPSAPSSSSNLGVAYSNIVSPLVVNPGATATGLNGGIAMYGSPHEALSMIGVAMKQEHMLTDENSTMA